MFLCNNKRLIISPALTLLPILPKHETYTRIQNTWYIGNKYNFISTYVSFLYTHTVHKKLVFSGIWILVVAPLWFYAALSFQTDIVIGDFHSILCQIRVTCIHLRLRPTSIQKISLCDRGYIWIRTWWGWIFRVLWLNTNPFTILYQRIRAYI